jgi:RNA polymerase sigma-70 factor (ECF subfamily)
MQQLGTTTEKLFMERNLFQQEFGKMVAVISKLFGLQYIELAEDIVSETCLLATETWQTKGIPKNPVAWLYTVAKQKNLYHLRRKNIVQTKVIPAINTIQGKSSEQEEVDFSQQNIKTANFKCCLPFAILR